MSTHPLDPLTREEIAICVEIIRAQSGLDETGWFETITLREPEKSALKAFAAKSTAPTREAFITCYEPSSNRTLEAIVDLDAGKLRSWDHIEGVQARIPGDEMALAGEIVKADPDFLKALAKRSVNDPDKVLVECWAAGNFGIDGEEGLRLAYGHCWVENDAGDNPYGRPIANLHPVIDLASRKILRIDDFGVEPLPPSSGAIIRDEQRSDVKALEITQPDGPSFTVDGHLVKWQKWQIRVGYDLREGLVLHQIGYEDKGSLRPIMHRASMAEMVVPYGDPSGGYYRRNAFDVGEYGIGQVLDSLALGCDCLGHIHYFDMATHDWTGAARTIKNAFCMHEEDFGILWKFTDRKQRTTVTRSRRLVISSISTIGNYIYGFFWYFYQDGTIGTEIKATGIPLPSGVSNVDGAHNAPLVAPGVAAHVHQHVFSFRFDMAVDGEKNSVAEVNFSGRAMGKDNPQGNAIDTSVTVFSTEDQAARELNLTSSRFWKVINKDSLNAVGEPVGYKLVPGVNAVPYLDPASPVAKRAGFMFKHFWATQYAERERFPAGWYPNQSAGGDGLPDWVQQKRSIDCEDVVVWYTLNYHHLPRPEDWPVQPVVYAAFHWMPSGFFDENPAMDVPTRR